MTLILLKVTALLLCGLAGASLARRAKAATRHALLASALAASFLVPIATLILPRVTFAVAVPERVAALAVPSPVVGSTPQAESSGGRLASRAVEGTNASEPWTIERVLVGLWMLGTCVVGAVPLRDLWILRRLQRDGLPWGPAADLTRELALSAGIRRTVRLVTHEDVRSPLTMGWLRPTLLMPVDATTWDVAALRRALTHEVEHIRRHDWPVQLMARAVCVALWFHPLAWAAFRRLALEAERACDDAVLAVHDQADYATQLVDLARRATGCQPAAGLTMAARGDLAARVTAILDPMQRRGRAGAPVCVAAAAAAMLFAAAIAPLQAVATVEQGRPSEGRRGADSSGAPGLLRAAERGDISRLRALIRDGADVNVVVSGDGSPLIAAARGGSLEAVRVLLDAGAHPGTAVEGDGNPLIAAAAGGFTPIVAELLDRGGAVNDVVPGDENPLMAASAAGHLDVVRLLVSRGADVHASVWSGTPYSGDRGEWRTALGQARRHGHDHVAQFLAAAGARR